MIAAEATSFVQTWAHPSFRDTVNTALSLDHLAAEGFMEGLTFVVGLVVGKRWLRNHDRKVHKTLDSDNERVLR